MWNSNIACVALVFALGLIPIATNIVCDDSNSALSSLIVAYTVRVLFFDTAVPRRSVIWQSMHGKYLIIPGPVLQVSLVHGFSRLHAGLTSSPDVRIYFRLVTRNSEIRSIVLMTTRASVIAGDVIVLLVTWLKTWRTYRMASGVNMKVSLSYLILRDGMPISQLVSPFCVVDVWHRYYILRVCSANTICAAIYQLIDHSQHSSRSEHPSNPRLRSGEHPALSSTLKVSISHLACTSPSSRNSSLSTCS